MYIKFDLRKENSDFSMSKVILKIFDDSFYLFVDLIIHVSYFLQFLHFLHLSKVIILYKILHGFLGVVLILLCWYS